MTILFRSRYGRSHHRGTSHKYTPLSGEDWSDITTYTMHDNSRDIIWKKSTSTDIRVKKRHDQQEVKLIFAINIDEKHGDNFTHPISPTSRSAWKHESAQILKIAAIQ